MHKSLAIYTLAILKSPMTKHDQPLLTMVVYVYNVSTCINYSPYIVLTQALCMVGTCNLGS